MIPGVIMRMPDGQEYECTGTVPHTNRYGRKMKLLRWLTQCRACGVGLVVKSRVGKLPEKRNCSAHRGMRKKMIAASDFGGGASSRARRRIYLSLAEWKHF